MAVNLQIVSPFFFCLLQTGSVGSLHQCFFIVQQQCIHLRLKLRHVGTARLPLFVRGCGDIPQLVQTEISDDGIHHAGFVDPVQPDIGDFRSLVVHPPNHQQGKHPDSQHPYQHQPRKKIKFCSDLQIPNQPTHGIAPSVQHSMYLLPLLSV